MVDALVFQFRCHHMSYWSSPEGLPAKIDPPMHQKTSDLHVGRSEHSWRGSSTTSRASEVNVESCRRDVVWCDTLKEITEKVASSRVIHTDVDGRRTVFDFFLW